MQAQTQIQTQVKATFKHIDKNYPPTQDTHAQQKDTETSQKPQKPANSHAHAHAHAQTLATGTSTDTDTSTT